MQSNKFGTTIKKIRKNKNLSQSFISDGKISRSSIAKIENNSVNPSIDTFQTMLQQLSIPFDEFFYIHNHYKLSEQDQLLNKFCASLSSSNKDLFAEMLEQCNTVLKKKENQSILDLKHVILAILEVSNNNFIEAEEYVTPIWNRLSKVDNWYLSDIKIINSILYIFPTETAITIANHALKQLVKYEDFLVNKRIKIGLKLNLAALLIKNEESPTFIIRLLDEILVESKKQRLYDCYAIALFRKGICLSIESNGELTEDVDNALKIFELLDETHLLNSLLREKNFFLSKKNKPS